MILPSKYLREDRALIGVGADILGVLDEPRTVSAIWECVRTARVARPGRSALSFDWFILALCFLHAIAAVELTADGRVLATGRAP
jgi:hypothetical protein